MHNEARLAQIKHLVESSTILTAQEKTDWLSLTSLMNDKQLSELEEILKQPQDANQPAQNTAPPASLPVSSVRPSTLSHISNMPSQVSGQRTSTLPKKEYNSPMPAYTPTKIPVATPVLNKPTAIPTEVKKPTAPQALQTGETVSSRVRPMGKDLENKHATLNSLADVSLVTADVLSGAYRGEFYAKITGLVAEHGYFQVLTLLEQSPLYHDYLEYGQQKLSGNNQSTLPLSQEEFEFITDLLLSLKINRL